jgi:hypothetical protein
MIQRRDWTDTILGLLLIRFHCINNSPMQSQCWYVKVSDLLTSVGIMMDRLPLFSYPMGAPNHLLPTNVDIMVAAGGIYLHV